MHPLVLDSEILHGSKIKHNALHALCFLFYRYGSTLLLTISFETSAQGYTIYISHEYWFYVSEDSRYKNVLTSEWWMRTKISKTMFCSNTCLYLEQCPEYNNYSLKSR